MKKRFKLVFGIIFALGIMCLGFSFGNFAYRNESVFAMSGGAIYLASGAKYSMTNGIISNHVVDNGGAVYVGDGATFIMSGGTISGCSATNGGAVYIASGGTFIYTGGMIENCSATLGYAIYVASGGTLNCEANKSGFSSCGEDQDLHIYAEDGAKVVDGNTTINIYVDGVVSKSLKASGNSYTINEDEMPLNYESCCGYFYDERLGQCTNGEVDLTRATDYNINIYTKTASAASNFIFMTNSTTNTYDIKASSESISGSIVLPKEYKNIQTSISTYTFYNCSSMTGITFQDGLTSIAKAAFYSLTGLNCEIVIPDSVTSIGEEAFYECGITGDLTIPNSVTSIGGSAFYHCYSLSGVLTIGNSVTSIGNSAFTSCKFTGELTIPNSVTSIGNCAFAYCRGFTGNLIIPDSVVSIGGAAFDDCSGFTGNLIIPNSVISLGSSSFSRCSGLKSTYLPSSVTTITASTYYSAIFFNSLSSLVIYTDVVDANSIPSGWGTYWNYYDSSTQYTVNYGVSLEEYKAAVGLTFAANVSGENIESGLQVYNVMPTRYEMGISEDYNLEAILNDEKQYAAILKENEKVA